MAGSGFCKPHTCSGEEGGRRLTSIHHRQRWRDPSPRVGDMSNRLIVVSNRLPLTLRKADGRWTTERSSGGLASAMNPILRRNGGDWIGWAGASGEEDQEERRSVLRIGRKKSNASRSSYQRRSQQDSMKATPTKPYGRCFTTSPHN